METILKVPFEIKDNVLEGEKVWNPINQEHYINIGDVILQAFKSNPYFIGQIDAETGEQNTFKQMRERSIKCALWMLRLGIQSNDVITICSHNQLDAYIPFLAALYIGAVVNPLDEHSVKGNLVYFLKQTKPRILFIDEKFSATANFSMLQVAKIEKIKFRPPKLVIFGKTEKDKTDQTLESILNDYYNSASIENFSCAKMINIKSTAIRLFTSGTTASPKDIELPRSVLMAPLDQLAPYLRLNDVGLWFESLGFINGIFMTIVAILMHVKVIKIKSKFHTEYVCKLIEQHKVTWMFLEASMCTQLIISGDLPRYDVSSLKTVVFSGSMINTNIIYDGFKKWLPNIFISQTYSLTETGIIAYQRQSGNTGSSGYVSGNVQLKIVPFISSETQRLESLGPNILGEICCISPYMMIRKNHETCDGQFYSNWFRTGDLGIYDKNGEIYIRGRINQLYNYNEHIISPALTEKVLQCHFAVAEAAVIPVPCKFNEKHAMAFVTKLPGKKVTEEELKEFVVKNLNVEYQLGAGVIFLSQLPRIPNGKINRKLLHDLAQTYIYE